MFCLNDSPLDHLLVLKSLLDLIGLDRNCKLPLYVLPVVTAGFQAWDLCSAEFGCSSCVCLGSLWFSSFLTQSKTCRWGNLENISRYVWVLIGWLYRQWTGHLSRSHAAFALWQLGDPRIQGRKRQVLIMDGCSRGVKTCHWLSPGGRDDWYSNVSIHLLYPFLFALRVLRACWSLSQQWQGEGRVTPGSSQGSGSYQFTSHTVV